MSLEVIPFEIAHCSSFEEGYEPDHLVESGNEELDPNEQYTGWQTKKYRCPFSYLLIYKCS